MKLHTSNLQENQVHRYRASLNIFIFHYNFFTWEISRSGFQLYGAWDLTADLT